MSVLTRVATPFVRWFGWANYVRAKRLAASGHFDEAIPHFEAALNWYLTGGEDHPYVAACYIQLGAAHAKLGRTGAAKRAYTSALHIIERTAGPDHPKAYEVRRYIRDR